MPDYLVGDPSPHTLRPDPNRLRRLNMPTRLKLGPVKVTNDLTELIEEVVRSSGSYLSSRLSESRMNNDIMTKKRKSYGNKWETTKVGKLGVPGHFFEEIFSKPKDLKTRLNQYRAYQIYASNTLQLIFTTNQNFQIKVWFPDKTNYFACLTQKLSNCLVCTDCQTV